MTIAHYSYQDEKEGVNHFEAIGRAFLTLVSTHLSITANLKEEKKWDYNAQCIKKHLIKKYSNKLLLSELHNHILFGPGITESEKKDDKLLGLIFTILIGQLVAEGNFQKLYKALSDSKENVRIDSDNINFKTRLQEFLQKLGKSLPTYESIDISGPQHDQTFKVKINAAGISGMGEGRSKKKAESDAAKKLYKKLDTKYSDPVIKLKGISFDFIKENLKQHRLKFNTKVYQKLGISPDIDLMPALIHPRMKGHGFWGNSSQRSLSMLGAHLLDVVIGLYAYKKFTKDEINDHNRATLANEILANDKLAEIYTTGFFNIGKLPFKHEELALTPYKVDCVQGLAAISFLNFMQVGNLQAFFETDFIKWLRRRADFICSKDVVSLRNNLSSIVVERLGSIGLIYAFHKYEDNLGVKLSLVNGGGDFDYYPPDNRETTKDQKQYLSSLFIKGIDAYEGVGLTGQEAKNSRSFFREVSQFIDAGLIKKNRKYAFDNDLKLELFDVNNCDNYSGFDYEQLVSVWNGASDLKVEEKVELLARIRVFLGINESLVEAKEFIYLPIIFDEYFTQDEAKSIIDFTQSNEDEKLDELCEILSKEPLNKNEQPNVTLKIKKVNRNVEKQDNTIPLVSSENAKKSNVNSASKQGNEALIKLDIFLKSIKCKPISVLENMWKNKDTMVGCKEEAAILLAQLRYERGIDFSLLSYKTFIKSDLISKLDLPSIFDSEIKVLPNTSNNSKVNTIATNKPVKVNAEKHQFKLNTQDEREFSLKKVATRKGQTSFRNTLLDEWKICCISGCDIKSILEAAHIAPYRGDKDNHIQNGLILRVDIHRLFDSYMIGINPDNFIIELCPELKNSEYSYLAGKKIENGERVSQKALQYRWQYFINNSSIL
jgi:dsRNA-specific ribonuclease